MYTREIKKILLPALLLTLIGATTACSSKSNDDQKSEEQQVVPVTVTQVQKTTYHPSLRFSGTAEASKSANLGTALPGRIEKIHYNKGSYVPQGALIVEMSDEMLVQAQIENDAIKRDFARITRLREKESVSQMDYDHVKAKYEASVAKVAMLKKNTSIVAPFSGVITQVLMNEGETYTFTPSLTNDLKLESGIVELLQINPLKVTVEVNEKELGNIKVGQDVSIAFDAYPSETIKGKISYIPPYLSSTTRTASIEVAIPNNGNRFKPGMYCNVVISLPEREGIFIPLNAIYRLTGTSEEYVFKLNDDSTTVSRIPIERGEITEGMAHVDSGDIKEGDTIIIDGKNKLNDGSEVNIVKK